MAQRTSTLTMRLIDAVSGPAAKAKGALNRLDAAARGVHGKRGGLAYMAGGGIGSLGAVAAGAGGYLGARAVKSSITNFAELERHMTRIAITAESTKEKAQEAAAELWQMANDMAMPISQVVDGLDQLVADGRTLEESLAFMPSIVATAQASGAAVEDIAKSAYSLGTTFGIAADEMQYAFDILVAGGKAGMFELKDMAKYLPSIAPAMAAIGYEGEEGLRKLVAMLQIARKQAGTAEEAATNIANVLQKLETERVAKKFSEMGIDIRKELEHARASGEDLIDVYLELVERATKGDMSKIPLIFTDLQMQKGIRALTMLRGELTELEGALKDVDGSTIADLNVILSDTQADLDQAANSVKKFSDAFGSLAVSAGVVDVLRDSADQMERMSTAIDSGRWRDATDSVFGVGSSPQAETYRKAFKEVAGVEPPDGRAGDMTPWGADWLREALGVDLEAELADIAATARADAKRFKETGSIEGPEVSGKELTPAGRKAARHGKPPPPASPAVAAEPEPEPPQEPVSAFDLDENGIPIPPSRPHTMEYGKASGGARARRNPRVLPPEDEVKFAPFHYPLPEEPEDESKDARPQGSKRQQWRHGKTPAPEPQDLSAVGADTMETYNEGARKKMAAFEAEVDQFVSRISSKLSFSASPTINASYSVAGSAPVSTAAAGRAMGREVEGRMSGAFGDESYA